MADPTYTPPAVWSADTVSGGRFASINRPTAGAREEKALPVGKHPFQLYSLATPNGVKVTVLLEELLEAGHAGAEYDAWTINIGAGEQFVQFHLGDAQFHRAVIRQEGIIGDHLHAQAAAAVGHDRADVAAADDAQRLVEELDAHEAVLLPLAGLGGGIGFRQLASERDHFVKNLLHRNAGEGIEAFLQKRKPLFF